jgi:hypothetical protein
MKTPSFTNPFRPGAGHAPPYLAGREEEKKEFALLLEQSPVLDNLVLTGLRGVGKTVLLETFKPIAIQSGWLWAGTDLSEGATLSEDSIAIRILADLAPLVSGIKIADRELPSIGFSPRIEKQAVHLDYATLRMIYDQTPGLTSDKLKAVLELVWRVLSGTKCRGIVLAYDEAQNLSDQAASGQYPLSVLLDVFQSIQKRGLPFLLVFTGLPTLFPKLVDARTFAERMFHVVVLGRLNEADSRDAILKPIAAQGCPVSFTTKGVAEIIRHSGGYPYFIQFLCREFYDTYLQYRASGQAKPAVRVAQMVLKLDSDFFAGRWSRVTDRQRELLSVIAQLPNCDDEFTPTEIVAMSHEHLKKSFSASHVNQMLVKLSDSGLVYKNRHGKYSFAVPLLGQFIRRQQNGLSDEFVS